MKKRVLNLIILFCVIFVGGFIKVDAKIVLKECEYSDKFVEYMNLSNDEKKKTAMPNVCKSISNGYSLIGNTLGSITQSSFDLRNINGKKYVTDVKNQGETNTCWAYATNASIESNMLVNGSTENDLSESHMDLSTQNTFPQSKHWYPNRTYNSSGNYNISTGYLLSRQGPILEEDFPFSILTNAVSTNSFDVNKLYNKKVVANVNKVAILSQSEQKACNSTSISKIKSYLVTNGAITAMMYWDNNYLTTNDNTYGPYYYNGSLNVNHGVTIVGWDDSISSSNFGSIKPSRDGAFIVKNSYGTELEISGQKIKVGDNGYFYVSYEDTLICDRLFGFYDMDNVSNVAYTNQEAYLGINLALKADGIVPSYDNTPAYLGNRFSKKTSDSEKLRKISFASPGEGIGYQIYYINSNSFSDSSKSIDDYTLLASGTTTHEGIESVDVSNKNINISEEFSIVVKYNSYNGDTYVPITMRIQGTLYDNVNPKSGVAFLSVNGKTWEDMGEAGIFPNIYAYTDGKISFDNTTNNENNNTTNNENNNTTNNDKNNTDNNVIIQENENNKTSYILKDSYEMNPKTNDVNSFIVFVIIILAAIVSIVVKKKMKKYGI